MLIESNHGCMVSAFKLFRSVDGFTVYKVLRNAIAITTAERANDKVLVGYLVDRNGKYEACLPHSSTDGTEGSYIVNSEADLQRAIDWLVAHSFSAVDESWLDILDNIESPTAAS